jgi:hypothetical protein
MHNPPFNTGKVLIGLLYVPRPQEIQGDAARLQAALLKPQRPLSAGLRLVNRVLQWL